MTQDFTPESASILHIGEEQAMVPSMDAMKTRTGIRGLYTSLNARLQMLTRIQTKEKVTFFQLLAIMISAGVPLVKSLYVLSNQGANPRMRHVLATMAQKVEGGKTLSDAMIDFSGIFTDAQVGMVRAGEASGQLNEVLKDIADQAEKAERVSEKIRGAMIYPAVVFTLMGGAVFVIITYVLPKIMELFTQTNATLPATTRFLLAISDFLRGNIVVLGVGVVLALLMFTAWKKTPGGRYQWHRFILHLPVFGVLLRYVALSRFTRSLASLMESGIPIVQSLQINADSVGNDVYRKRLYLAAEDVSRGIPLAENLVDSTFLFPEMVVSMIAIGEQTAELSKVSRKIADYYDDLVDQMASNMTKLLEPIIMAVMGVVVGGLMVAVMQPIFGLLDVVGNV